MGEFLADVGKDVVIHTEAGLVEERMLFEDDAVVDAVEPAAGRDEIFPCRSLIAELVHQPLLFDSFVFEEANEDQPVEGALGSFGQLVAGKLRIVFLEGFGQFHAILVEVFQKCGVNAFPADGQQTALDGFAARFGKFCGAFLQRAGGDGLAGEQPVDFGKLLFVGVVAVVVLGDRAIQRGL